MYKFKTIMVALDLSRMDEKLLSYTAEMCAVVKPSKIYFVNIQANLDLDDEVKELLGNDGQPMDEFCENKMKTTVAQFFPSHTDYDIDYEIVEGNPAEEILRWTKMKDTDLLVMGRKNQSKGGITPQQVSSKVKCSVLIVPEFAQTFSLNNIFVPVDFSNYSKEALEEALYIDQNHPSDTTITCGHIYELPLGYEKSGKSAKEFASIMEKNASKKCTEFIDSIPYETNQVTVVYNLNEEGDLANTINEVAHDKRANLIIMGAKGRTMGSHLFLGSVTEKLIKYDSDIPLLIAKDKSKTFDFWEMIKSL
ncbi:MAG: universal stress protein [Chitinophagales bacterium]